jgi:hypothetical protein
VQVLFPAVHPQSPRTRCWLDTRLQQELIVEPNPNRVRVNRVRVPSCRTEYEYEYEYEYDEYQEQDHAPIDHAPTDPVGSVAHRDERSSTSVIVFDREPGKGACPFSLWSPPSRSAPTAPRCFQNRRDLATRTRTSVQPWAFGTQGHQERGAWSLVGSSGSQSPGEPGTIAGNEPGPQNSRADSRLENPGPPVILLSG